MATGPKKDVESISTLEIKPQGLGACIGGNFLTVPKYQRAFSWDEENVANFLADVNTAFADGRPSTSWAQSFCKEATKSTRLLMVSND